MRAAIATLVAVGPGLLFPTVTVGGTIDASGGSPLPSLQSLRGKTRSGPMARIVEGRRMRGCACTRARSVGRGQDVERQSRMGSIPCSIRT